MNSASRRSPLSFRERKSKSLNSRKFSWRLSLSIIVGIGVFIALGWLLTRQPRGYECLTSISTVCPSEINDHFANIQDTPLWQIQKEFEEKKQENPDPRIVSASLSLSPLQIALVRIELAEPLFPFSTEGNNWVLLSNGKLQPRQEPAFPNLEFTEQRQAIALTEEQRQELKSMYQRLRSFSPRVRKILVLTPTEVEVYPENAGKILFTLQDVERQLATLQAFFRSTTINQTYQVLDVRFSEVAVIKE